jgi:hypothetical protein
VTARLADVRIVDRLLSEGHDFRGPLG